MIKLLDNRYKLIFVFSCLVLLISVFKLVQAQEEGNRIYIPFLSNANNDGVHASIAGGNIVQQQSSWMVAIVESSDSNDYSSFFCGGTLISPNWVLSAAHCPSLMGLDEDDIDVVIGKLDLRNSGGERIGVKSVKYNSYVEGQEGSYKLYNDIVLFELDRPSTDKTVSLYTPYLPYDFLKGLSAKTMGWGRTSSQSSTSPQLREVSLPIRPSVECQNSNAISDDDICSYSGNHVMNFCNGDSGGPLLALIDGEWKQIGIVSFNSGTRCENNDFYNYFERVSKHSNWIHTTICGSPGCDLNPPEPTAVSTPTSIAQPPTPVVSTPTRQSTTPTPVATTGAPVSCSNIGWFNQTVAHTFSEKNCLGESSWNSDHGTNGPGASRQKSIYVPVGKVLWIYEHDNKVGKSECLSGSVADLAAIGWENKIQSAYLESGSCFVPTPIATIQVKEVRFYKEPNFEGGQAFTLPEGDHRPENHGFFRRFPMFNSMRICKGCVVTIWDSQSDDSKCWVYDEDKVGSHGLYGQDAVRILISASPNPVCEPWHAKYSSPQKEAVYALGEDIVIGWRAGDDFSNRYTVEVWNENWSLIYNQIKSSVQTYTLRGLPVGKYFIRMQSHWGNNHSEWRDRYFYVMANPSKPEIRLPYPDQVFRPGDEVDVHWGRTDLTTTEFKTQLWCNWELLEETGRVTYGSKWFGPLPEGDCMAQVESFNQVGSSGWTQRLFKVRPEPPASPDIYHPTEGQAFHSRYTVLIAWYPIPTASQYNVELWGPTGLVKKWLGTTEVVLVAGHLPQGSYRVRIHSLDKWGQFQGWKDTTFFTVDPTPTPAPTNTAVPTATATDTKVPTAVATATEVLPTSTNTPRVTSTPVLTATSTVVASRTPVPTNTPRPTSTSVPATSTPGSGQPTGERIYLPLVMR